MPAPTVSVLMTAYNREKYIAEAIESVLASTFQDFELIIVDDCSTDRTVEIARRYLSDPRVQVHVNEKNLGDYPNRNRAAELARGRYLKYVDSDDIIYPHGLGVMVQAMEQFPDAGLGLSRPPSPNVPYPVQVSPEQAYREHFLGVGLLVHAPLSAIIKAESFRAVSGFSGRRQIGDVELWLKLGARYPVVKMATGFVWWRNHGEQEYMYDSQVDKLVQNYSVALSALVASACPLSVRDCRLAIDRLRSRQVRNAIHFAIKKRNLGDAIKMFRASNLKLSELLILFRAT